MGNHRDKKENLHPQDSGEKEIRHPQDDNEAVVKDEDKEYNREDPDIKNPAGTRERSEQPVHPVKSSPEEKKKE